MKINGQKKYHSQLTTCLQFLKKFPFLTIFLACLILGALGYLFVSVISVPIITPWLENCEGSFFCFPNYYGAAILLILIGAFCLVCIVIQTIAWITTYVFRKITKSKNKKPAIKLYLIPLIAIAVIAFLYKGVPFLSKTIQEEKYALTGKRDLSQIFHTGSQVIANDSIYYFAADGFRKCDLDGANDVLLREPLKSSNGRDIPILLKFADNKHLYFSYGGNSTQSYRISLANPSEVTEINGDVDWRNISGEYLYYQEDFYDESTNDYVGKLSKINTTISEIKLIVSPYQHSGIGLRNNISVDNGKTYYYEGTKIYDEVGNSYTTSIGNNDISGLVVKNNYAYYKQNAFIIKYNLSSGKIENSFTTDSPIHLQVGEKNASDDSILYLIATDSNLSFNQEPYAKLFEINLNDFSVSDLEYFTPDELMAASDFTPNSDNGRGIYQINNKIILIDINGKVTIYDRTTKQKTSYQAYGNRLMIQGTTLYIAEKGSKSELVSQIIKLEL